MSISSTPADCDASTTKYKPCSRQNAPICPIGSAFPVTLDACVHTTPRVLGRSARAKSSMFTHPFASAGKIVSCAPCSSSRYSGRNTELCSSAVVMIWSPGANKPKIAVFSASVALCAKHTRAGSGSPNNCANCSRHCNTAREAASESGCAPRPGEPIVSNASHTACLTCGGFKKEVAAASK